MGISYIDKVMVAILPIVQLGLHSGLTEWFILLPLKFTAISAKMAGLFELRHFIRSLDNSFLTHFRQLASYIQTLNIGLLLHIGQAILAENTV
jgi:hypothetical protein